MTDSRTQGFLALPREIRNRIYSYVVLFDDPLLTQEAIDDICRRESPTGAEIGVAPPGVDLSVLRVNKQIHEEASNVFYTQNIFSIKIVTEGWESYQGKQCFRARWTTPWEDIGYRFAEEEGGLGYFCPGNYGGKLGDEIMQDEIKTYVYPSTRYRHLLRRVRIEVIDTCFLQQSLRPATSKRESGTKRQSVIYGLFGIRASGGLLQRGIRRVPLRAIFMPLACRLRCLLANCSAQVKIDIKISTTRLENFDDLSIKVYKELVELVSPFTRGYQVSNIALQIPFEEDHELDPKYEGLKDKAAIREPVVRIASPL
ncbi:hypothetical protein Dda_8749 [Drechslerella dactyloides]|uniref:Uncharacterized protein n=1 Tax=Drechslerella dactyloides TaxID=74499 RepID=A0AAD6IS15_DREDA|nr:hypothetical protein Dda_8749 [Drechslerella dactyloides]